MAQNEGWQPKFEEVQADVEYYLYNVGTKTYLNDDNTLSAIPSTTWTVDVEKKEVKKSQKDEYISVTSSSRRENLITTVWEVTGTSTADAAGLGTVGNNGSYYYFYSNVQYNGWGQKRDHYFQAIESGVNANATNANNASAQWIFVSKSIYDETFSVSENSVNVGNAVTNKQKTVTISLTHSPRLGDVTVSSDNDIFTVSPATIEGGEGAPTVTEIAITYNAPKLSTGIFAPSSQDHSGNITIKVGDQSIVIPVSGTTKKALNLSSLNNAISHAKGIIGNAEANAGFDKGQYAPYNGVQYRNDYNTALDMVEHQADYTQSQIDQQVKYLNDYNLVTNHDSHVWQANSSDLNAVAPNTVITNVYGTDAPNYLMPLKGNQLYKLSFNYTGTAKVSVKDANGNDVANFTTSNATESASYTYTFTTAEAGNYTIHVSGAELTNVKLVKTSDPSKDWTAITLEDGGKYLFINKVTGYFIGSSNTMLDHGSMVFTAEKNEDGTYAFKNEDGTYLNINIVANDGLILGVGGGPEPDGPVTVSPTGEKTYFTVEESNGGYTLNASKSWNYTEWFQSKPASYSTYLSAVESSNSATLSEKTEVSDPYNVWVLVSEEEYNNSPALRQDAIDRLREAVAAGEAAKALGGPASLVGEIGLDIFKVGGELTNRISTGKSYLRTMDGWLSGLTSNLVPTNTLLKQADDIYESIDKLMNVLPAYEAAKATISEIDDLGGIVTAGGLFDRGIIELATTPETMINAATTLRNVAAAAVAAQSLGGDLTPFKDGTNFTGLIANNSFDFGSMAGWYTLSFESDLTKLWSAITSGGLGALTGIVKIQDFADGSKPVVNEAPNAVAEGHNRFYYNTQNGGIIAGIGTTGQPVFQPLIGLPAGSYKASALMTTNTLVGNTFQNYISAIVIPTNILGDIIGNIDITDPTNMGNLLNAVIGSMGTIITQGALKTGSNNPQSNNKFEEVSVEFEIEDGAIVILVLNSGIALPLVGAEPFRADNVRLVMTQSRKSAKDELAAALKGANIPEANIAAKASNNKPFTYNQALVNQYKSLNDAAQALKDNGSNSTIDMHNAASALADFSATFFDKAFQGPTADGLFNLTIKDTGANCTDKSVTFKYLNNQYSMLFTDDAGSTNYHQAVGFEHVGEAVNTYVVSITDVDGNKDYLKGTTSLSTTPNVNEAAVFTVVPSYTVETVAALNNGTRSLGVGNNSNTLACVAASTNRTPTYSTIAVTPAAKHNVDLNISSLGWGTFMLPYDAEIPSGVKAYKATGVENNAVVLDEVYKFEACVPYIVSAEGGKKETLSGIALATQNFYTEGILKGANEISPVVAEAGNYLLQNNNNKIGFYYVADEGLKIGANRAFLMYDGAQPVKMFVLDGEATAIESIGSEAGKDVIFDLSGRRVNNAGKGVYIINGKKVIK